MSPDHDQAIMFHGSNLQDVWRHSRNGKILRAMPHEDKGEMHERSEGVWCAHGEEALKYAPWSYLAHGWMARIALIFDRTAADKVPPLLKGTIGSSGKSNQTILVGRGGCRTMSMPNENHLQKWQSR